MRPRRVPDFVYWMLFVVLTSLHYYTKTEGATEQGYVEFFIIVWLVSFIGLIALKIRVPEPSRAKLVDYDENLSMQHLDSILLGLLLVKMTARRLQPVDRLHGNSHVVSQPQPQMV